MADEKENQFNDNNQDNSTTTLADDLMAAAAIFDDNIDTYSPLKSTSLTKMTTRLFGLPYQFSKTVDPRVYSKTNWEESLNSVFGRHFLTYFLVGAPIMTVIPGKPKYNKSISIDQMMLSQAGGGTDRGNFSKLIDFNNNNDCERRFYGFQQDYKNFFNYVNVLCRACAIFMEIGDVCGPGMDVPYASYDWKNYRLDGSSYADTQVDTIQQLKSWALTSVANKVEGVVGTAVNVAGWFQGFAQELTTEISSAFETIGDMFDFNKEISSTDIAEDISGDTVSEISTESGAGNDEPDDATNIEGGTMDSIIDYNTIEELLNNHNFIQFYIDPTTSSVSESLTNKVGPSKFESIQSSVSDLAKEIGFLINSGGIDANSTAIGEYIHEGIDAISDALSGTNTLTNIFSTILGSFNSSLVGESVVFPEIWQANEFSKTYTIKIKLRSVYGHREAYYLDVMVPLMHILAMALPKQTSTNSFGSPFIHRIYYPGIFSCNMGIVTSLEIDKHQNDCTWTIDGFPNEVDVTMQIADLYSDLPMTSGNDPDLFINNDSLLAYLGTICGIDYTSPTIAKKQSLYLTVERNAGTELGAMSTIERMADQFVTNLIDDTVSFYSIA